MCRYTEILNETAEILSPEDDDYEEKLLEVAAAFRGFDEALTEFISEHGYAGSFSDAEAKTKFLREKFKSANIPIPRNIRSWFMADTSAQISRKTAYQICFALELNVSETNGFFRCVQFERGFDCHTIEEAVWYFCIRNHRSYTEAQKILKKIPVTKRGRLPKQDALYTGTIVEYIDSIDDEERLIQYISDNINDFQYNNATAVKSVRELWHDISGENGLAFREGTLIEKYNYSGMHTEKEIERKRLKEDDRVVADQNPSAWTIFAQMIGLTNRSEREYAVRYDRSLNQILTKSALLPVRASYCFPSQHGISQILRGEPASNEMVRKMLILLTFYTYWVKIMIRQDDVFYVAKHQDTERCFATLNARLIEAGYPELYSGNPYDWIFLWAMNDEHPMEAFRCYMGEVFAVGKEMDEQHD